MIEALTEEPIDDERQYKISERKISGTQVFIAAHNRCGEPGFDLFIPAEFAPKVLETVLTRGAVFGARQAGEKAFEIARIEAGIPREGVDAGENYIILESELSRRSATPKVVIWARKSSREFIGAASPQSVCAAC